MRRLLNLFVVHVRLGSLFALLGGILIGVSLGLLLVSLEHAPLLLPDVTARVSAVVLLASLCALISIGLLFAIELGVACALTVWPSLRPLHVGWLYVSVLVTGLISLHAFLWTSFNIVKDITQREGGAISASLLLAALGLLLILIRLQPRPSVRAVGPSATLLATLVAVSAGLAAVSYHALGSRLPAVSYRPIGSWLSPTGAKGGVPTSRSSPVAQTLSAHPNVMLISIDTLRPDHLGCYGYARDTSPHIDELARAGTLFRNARAQAPWTLPSHASMLTSLYPTSHGVRFWNNSRFVAPSRSADRLGEWHLTLAELLQAEGYRTGAFTSSAWLSAPFGFGQGFDTFDVGQAHTAATRVDKAMRWIEQDRQRPFFLFLHLLDVHHYTSVPGYVEKYVSPEYAGTLKTDPALQTKITGNLFRGLTEADLGYVVARYDAAIGYVDAQLGRLSAWLWEAKAYERTLIVLTSDHGEELWDHRGTGHGQTLYEEQLRVPLVIKPPRGSSDPSGRAEAADVGVIDIMPTILDYVDARPPFPRDGVSLRPLIETDAERPPRTFFAEDTLFFNSYAVIEKEFKYICNRIPPPDILNLRLLFANVRAFYKFRSDELYRINGDRNEKVNLATAETATSSRMRNQLLTHIKGAGRRERAGIDATTIEELRSLGYIQ